METGSSKWKPLRLFSSKGAFILENPIYRRLMRINPNREKAATWAGVEKEMEVLELGPGPGYYTPSLARKVKPGRIHALDIQEGMIAKLKKKLKKARIENVETYAASAEELPFENGSIDLVWAFYVLEEVVDLEKVAKELYRVLRPKGLVCIAQFALDFTREQKEAMQEIFPKVGFNLLEEVDTWWQYKAKYRK